MTAMTYQQAGKLVEAGPGGPDAPKQYRVIAAQGKGDSDNKTRVYGCYAYRALALAAAQRTGGVTQEALGEGFSPGETWDWTDWAHGTGITAGHVRNIHIEDRPLTGDDYPPSDPRYWGAE